MSKKGKFHLYFDGAEETRDGYGKTACGRDGSVVGGLIPPFFARGLRQHNCKTCQKIFDKLEAKDRRE